VKALVKVRGGAGFLEYVDIPEPTPGPGEVKIQVKACGVCGTDLHIRHDTFPNFPPVVLGHEFSGVVTELGPGVTGMTPGQRVVSEVVFETCGQCRSCKTGYYNLCLTRRGLGWAADGAFAPYTVVEAKNIHLIPDNLSFEEAALSEPLAVCACAVCELTGVTAGDTVLVSGPGPIGLLTAQCAVAEGGQVVVTGTSADAERLDVAMGLGAHAVAKAETTDVVGLMRQLGDGLGADVVCECSGATLAAATGLEALRKGGRYVQVGLFGHPVELDLDQVTLKELKVQGVFSSNWRGWHRGLRLAAQNRVKLGPLVSHVFPLADWERAFEIAERKQGLKVLLIPDQT
jgi:L-iditol 2-dehydrogenase